VNYVSLLLKYLDYLRVTYQHAPEKQTVSNEEIEKALHLTVEESRTLGQLISVTQLFSNNASCGKESWSVGVLAESEDFPDGPLDKVLEDFVLRSYDTSYPVWYKDQIAKLSEPKSSLSPTAMASTTKHPKVFVSYSRDSEEHQQWVIELTGKLRHAGVDAVMDEFRVGPGGDLAHFMEQNISKADRVLLICTEKFVQRMDDREGGVGYEAYIASAELMKNVKTAKFIPVVRQKSKNPKLPIGMDTKYRINLSHGASYEKELEKLIRNLHGTPLHPEPPLGSNPYAAPGAFSPSDEEANGRNELNNPNSVYSHALALIQPGDFLGWRDLLWRTQVDAAERFADIQLALKAKIPNNPEETAAFLHSWHDNYQSFYAVSLAGILSAKPKFNEQSAVLDQLLRPQNWDANSGNSHPLISAMPESTIFLFQNLHGAACLESGQVSSAISLACTNFVAPSDGKPDHLFLIHPLNGWFDGSCLGPWHFLRELPKHWPWLDRVFAGSGGYLSSICAYYAALNLMELANLIKTNANLSQKLRHFDVPLMYNFVERSVTGQAYRKLTAADRKLEMTWTSFGVTYDQMKAHWDYWKRECYGLLAGLNNNQGVRPGLLIHEQILDEVSFQP
jgi:hypothetical protein